MEETTPNRHDESADALANMADGLHEEPAEEQPSDEQPNSSLADVDEQAGDTEANSDEPMPTNLASIGPAAPRRRTGGPRKPAQPTGFHFVAAQLSTAMGILLLVPVILSALILSGAVQMGQVGSRVPLVMLILATPLSLVMLIGGLWYGRYLRRFRQGNQAPEEKPET